MQGGGGLGRESRDSMGKGEARLGLTRCELRKNASTVDCPAEVAAERRALPLLACILRRENGGIGEMVSTTTLISLATVRRTKEMHCVIIPG